MVGKTERFEMRLDEDTLSRVDAWRAKQDGFPSRAEAMRRLVEIGLLNTSSKSVDFSDGEKVLIMMMRDIFKALKVRGETDVDFISEAIFGGHYWAPKWQMNGLFHDHADRPEDVEFVVDVLDMWSFIEEAYEKLPAKDKKRIEEEAAPLGKDVSFYGFDGNNESELTSIAWFLVEKLKRFTRFKGRAFDSHIPTAATYRRMLAVFEPIRSTLHGGHLGVDQIIRLMKARKYSG